MAATSDEPTNGTARPPLRERKRQRMQQLIYDTAVDLIIERGYEHVTVEEICDRAEVGRATFFRYYGSKAGLLLEFDRRVLEDIEQRLEGVDSAVAGLAVVQQTMAGAWAGVHPNLRALGRDYLASTAVSDMGLIAADITKAATTIIERGIEQGELRPLVPAATVAQIFITAVRIGVYRASFEKPRTRIPDETGALLELLLHGLVEP